MDGTFSLLLQTIDAALRPGGRVYQGRLATDALASLTESAVDLHLRDVAAGLLLPADPGGHPEAGNGPSSCLCW